MATKKTPTKVKKTPATKAKVAAKRAAPKKAVKKASPKAKKVTKSRKVAKVTVAKKPQTKPKTKTRNTKNDSGVVSLPNNMSLRSVEKSVVLRLEFEKFFQNSVYKVSYVSAACFILVGASLAASGLFKDTIQLQTATVASSTSTVAEVIDISTEFYFLDSFPQNIVDPFRVTFFATNVESVKAKIRGVGDSSFVLELPVEMHSEDKYRTDIPTSADVPPGYYDFTVWAYPLDGSSLFAERSPKFFIGSKEEEDIYLGISNEPESTAEIITDPALIEEEPTVSESEAVETSAVNTVITANSLTTSSPDPVSAVSETEVTPTEELVLENEPAEDSVAIVDKEEVVIIDLGTEEEVKETAQKPFALLIQPGQVLQETAAIPVYTPESYEKLGLYARPVSGLSPRFLAAATFRYDNWQFIFDTRQIPNGDYEFFALANRAGEQVKSEQVVLRVKNALYSDPVDEVIVVDTAVREFVKIETDLSDSNVETEMTTAAMPSTTSGVDEESVEGELLIKDDAARSYEEKVNIKANLLLLSEAETIDELLQNYSAAVQTQNDVLTKAAEEALQLKRERIIKASLYDKENRDIADDMNTALAYQIEDLQKRIQKFETLRRENSSGETAVDTDGDGVSDIDEKNLYGTDPSSSDTDGDGVSDSVEIMRGYDPLDARVEVVVTFESPKESVGLTRAETLVVADVIPSIRADSPTESTVGTEIRGKALPNSFVTLYIFSMPTVVTVRTDADGAFVYTYDKELADGKHDVFVAITDNAGEIVAQSNPFSFVKVAEAFTPVDAASEADVLTVPTPVDNNGYTIAAGVGILAFGLILLLLGLNFRQPRIILDTEKKSSLSNSDNKATTEVS